MQQQPHFYNQLPQKDLISDYNEAKFQILRLHSLWQSCNRYSQGGDLVKWRWALDTIWRELSADAKNKDKNKYELRFKDVNDKIKQAFLERNREKQYEALDLKDQELRFLQDEVGKGGKRHDKDQDEDFGM